MGVVPLAKLASEKVLTFQEFKELEITEELSKEILITTNPKQEEGFKPLLQGEQSRLQR